MTLSDRRLLIELGAVLVIKLILITLIKIYFFSPSPEHTVPDPARFFPEARADIEPDDKKSVPVSHSAESGHQDKER
ncbi:cytochrome oxidase putative small subunit CydP [Microbulbifer mangrovi]|uniref:cytochrome oxidase putative small subunit CydP n=1 Tax=Microbulbifer mangrovi TaxID=927787 RepID=UPI0009907114|nr:cytochrome oxidase putative small subunit CydP [Microbulbifer mangrovi]